MDVTLSPPTLFEGQGSEQCTRAAEIQGWLANLSSHELHSWLADCGFTNNHSILLLTVEATPDAPGESP